MRQSERLSRLPAPGRAGGVAHTMRVAVCSRATWLGLGLGLGSGLGVGIGLGLGLELGLGLG